MQLTKDDVKTEEYLDNTEPMGEDYISLSKFKQVVEFYENNLIEDFDEIVYNEGLKRMKNQHPHIYAKYINRSNGEQMWNDWLFNYCFVEGLK